MSEVRKDLFRRGREGVSAASGGSRFVKVKPNESVTVVPLVGLSKMLSADMHEYWDVRPAIFHPCLGRGCPGCAVEDNNPRWKAYMPVINRDGEVLVWAFSISIYNQLEGIEDEIDGDLAGLVLKIKRSGSGLSTRWQVLALGKRTDISDVEVPNFIEHLGPVDRDEIIGLLRSKGIRPLGLEEETEPAVGKVVGKDDDDGTVLVSVTEDDSSEDDDDGWGDDWDE